jgi:hypothetical protein
MSGRREILWEYGTFELITLESMASNSRFASAVSHTTVEFLRPALGTGFSAAVSPQRSLFNVRTVLRTL